MLGHTVTGIDAEAVTIEGAGRRARADPRPHRHLGRRRHRLGARGALARAAAPSSTSRAASPSSPISRSRVTRRCSRSETWSGSAPRRQARRSPASRRSRCRRAVTRRRRSARGSRGGERGRSTTSTRAISRRSGAPARWRTSMAPAQRLPGLVHLARRPPLVPGRLPEPANRLHPLVVQLPHPRPRRAADLRGSGGAGVGACRVVSL